MENPTTEAHSTIKFLFVLVVSTAIVVFIALLSYTFFGTQEVPKSIQEQQRESLQEKITMMLAEEQDVDPSELTVLVEKFDGEYIRASVRREGEQQSGLVFLTAAFGNWEIVHTGISPASCKMLYQFAFPKDFIVECSTDPLVAEAQMRIHTL